MERQRLMVGYDLCADYSQISYYNTEKEEPDSVNFDGQNEIPTVLCRLFSNGEWLAGQQALKAAQATVFWCAILLYALLTIQWWMWLVSVWKRPDS